MTRLTLHRRWDRNPKFPVCGISKHVASVVFAEPGEDVTCLRCLKKMKIYGIKPEGEPAGG